MTEFSIPKLSDAQKATMLNSMITLAAQRHVHQYDAMGKPYILHCMKVMHYLRADDDQELQCIALGHDLKEDGGVTDDDLRRCGFSERIIAGIDALTKRPGSSEYQQLTKIIGTEDGAASANLDACRVKLCDLRHNSDIRRSKGLTEKDFKRLQKYHRWYAAIQSKLTGTDLWKEILTSLRPKPEPLGTTFPDLNDKFLQKPELITPKTDLISQFLCSKCGLNWAEQGCAYKDLAQRIQNCPNMIKAQSSV